ncbi:hypothetical protein [Bifidobacterium olomucense]|uniref:Uncharacterized protein n=1 Tax=Bifidobacterium olomucense TaxID=2675324 RepID=A0A7Y0HW19_9BIFI|nr:hypothetical protein [Bifidobacterium sp. DSM 109959]NMM97846.1 hypothetical protein [Bifidobacterium sp. DSM 109959]
MTEINEIKDPDASLDESDIVAPTGETEDSAAACPKSAHCPLRHHPGMCGKNGKCPVKNLSQKDVVAGVVTLASMIALTAVAYYAQFALTKAAVKSALKETRLR